MNADEKRGAEAAEAAGLRGLRGQTQGPGCRHRHVHTHTGKRACTRQARAHTNAHTGEEQRRAGSREGGSSTREERPERPQEKQVVEAFAGEGRQAAEA